MTDLKAKSPRLLSLDVLRGLAVAGMILVNDPGDWGHIYWPIEHSKWDGCTLADLIFPFFLFMVGVSIVFSMESKRDDVSGHGQLLFRAFRRMVTLIVITLLIQLFYHPKPGILPSFGLIVLMGALIYINTTAKTVLWLISLVVIGVLAWLFYQPGLVNLRFPGVLQRIAVVYFICTLLYLKTGYKTWIWFFAAALIGYYVIMCFIPVPGIGPANLNPETNMGAWLDRLIFTTKHLWAESRTWDPEGLLGTIPAIGTGLFGIMVGTWLKRKDRQDAVKVSWLFIYGFAAVGIALIWNFAFPINKALWSSSFVLYTGGLGTMILAALYWLIDVQGHKKLTGFFVAFGINAITAYILADIVPGLIALIKINANGKQVDAYSYAYQTLFVPYLSPINASLAMAIAFVLLIWVMMWILYKKKVIIKV